MLFRQSIEPRCQYCQRGSTLEHDEVICVKKGVVPSGYHCRHFVYDPYKREPLGEAVPDFSHLSEQDFSL